jgi:hypothetical protein
LEAIALNGKQVLDIRASREDAFQVNPLTLDIDPNIWTLSARK